MIFFPLFYFHVLHFSSLVFFSLYRGSFFFCNSSLSSSFVWAAIFFLNPLFTFLFIYSFLFIIFSLLFSSLFCTVLFYHSLLFARYSFTFSSSSSFFFTRTLVLFILFFFLSWSCFSCLFLFLLWVQRVLHLFISLPFVCCLVLLFLVTRFRISFIYSFFSCPWFSVLHLFLSLSLTSCLLFPSLPCSFASFLYFHLLCSYTGFSPMLFPFPVLFLLYFGGLLFLFLSLSWVLCPLTFSFPSVLLFIFIYSYLFLFLWRLPVLLRLLFSCTGFYLRFTFSFSLLFVFSSVCLSFFFLRYFSVHRRVSVPRPSCPCCPLWSRKLSTEGCKR